MKVVILAGGVGTRLAEETETRPKPMIEVGGRPMLWHIMKIYAAHGYKEFIIACGYKGEMIKEYFHTFVVRNSDYVVDLKSGQVEVLGSSAEDWRVGVIDTGLQTMTGGRIRQLQRMIGDRPFMVTYGDGVGRIDIEALVAFHKSHGKVATLTAVHPPARFGALVLDGDGICEFEEKPQAGEGWINGGFFVFEPRIFDYLTGPEVSLEQEPLERLAAEGELMAFRHEGFWQPMDTLRDKRHLDAMWAGGHAPWKVWD